MTDLDQQIPAELHPDTPVEEQFQWTRHREQDVLALPLGPGSLVGSWFLNGEEYGVIVAEPQPGLYLVQFHYRAPGPQNQQLRSLDQMHEWQFFDDEMALRAWYAKVDSHG